MNFHFTNSPNTSNLSLSASIIHSCPFYAKLGVANSPYKSARYVQTGRVCLLLTDLDPRLDPTIDSLQGKNMQDFDKLAFPGAGCVQVVETAVRDCAIESVVVYADRAEVKRRVPVNLAAGKNEVVVHAQL